MPGHPEWLKKRLFTNDNIFETKSVLKELSVDTVCELALCPNLSECFSRRRATVLILGRKCTRRCAFCSVEKSAPLPVDMDEPRRAAEFVRRSELGYAVITSVTRDDLPDSGSGHFAKTVEAVRGISGAVKVEVLVPDFKADGEAIARVVRSQPDVFAHNIETARRLYRIARAGSDYTRSLTVLKMAKDAGAKVTTKSGIMVGLGETDAEIADTMSDLRRYGCDILTIGQYLQPRKTNMPVQRFVSPRQFEEYKELGLRLGFRHVSAGPFVRSSYCAEEMLSS
jgi:lipoic acid synthetase